MAGGKKGVSGKAKRNMLKAHDLRRQREEAEKKAKAAQGEPKQAKKKTKASPKQATKKKQAKKKQAPAPTLLDELLVFKSKKEIIEFLMAAMEETHYFENQDFIIINLLADSIIQYQNLMATPLKKAKFNEQRQRTALSLRLIKEISELMTKLLLTPDTRLKRSIPRTVESERTDTQEYDPLAEIIHAQR